MKIYQDTINEINITSRTIKTENSDVLMTAFRQWSKTDKALCSPENSGTSPYRKVFNHRKPQQTPDGVFVRLRNCEERIIGYRLLIRDNNIDMFCFITD